LPEAGPVAGPAHPLRAGDEAPGFCLASTVGDRVCLADHRGETVVLVFYPADHSPVCTQQLRSYNEDLNAFAALGATVFCLSPQGMDSHRDFAQQLDLRLPLLADEDRAVGQAYGVLGPLGFYRRSVFVIGPDGVIRFVRRSLSNLKYLPVDRLLAVVRDRSPAGPS
jgi:peroxiredoxin Q/BCP